VKGEECILAGVFIIYFYGLIYAELDVNLAMQVFPISSICVYFSSISSYRVKDSVRLQQYVHTYDIYFTRYGFVHSDLLKINDLW
jgi:5-carboxymethyl-2-hydroxymuconate isomerase